MASVLWQELTAEELRARAAADAIVILPVGSMEQHGPHLPTGVDTILCSAVCKAAAERVGGEAVVVAPPVWCGMAEHHMAFGGTFTFDIPTYRAVLLALLKSLERHGFHRVVIVNGHGGNIAALNAFLPDFARETSLRVLAVSYPDFANKTVAAMLQDQPGMLHACEVETSLMMAVAPGLVRLDRLSEAYDGETAETRRQGRRTIARYRSFQERCPSGVWGDARRASREKGEAIVEAIVAAMALRLADRDAEIWH